MLAAEFNRDGHAIVDHRTWFICSDGDLMEGISHEAASIAGFLGLEKLSGSGTTTTSAWTGPPPLAFGEDVHARFDAYGWRVLRVEDGNDVDAIDAALTEARGARRPAHPDRPAHAHRLRLPQQAGHLERPRLAARARRGRRHQAQLRLAGGRPVPGAGRGRRVGAGDGRPRPAAPVRVGGADGGLRRRLPRRRPPSCAAAATAGCPTAGATRRRRSRRARSSRRARRRGRR